MNQCQLLRLYEIHFNLPAPEERPTNGTIINIVDVVKKLISPTAWTINPGEQWVVRKREAWWYEAT